MVGRDEHCVATAECPAGPTIDSRIRPDVRISVIVLGVFQANVFGAVEYTVTKIGAGFPRGYSYALGLNNSGAVVGYDNVDGSLYTAGTTTHLGNIVASNLQSNSINTSGTVGFGKRKWIRKRIPLFERRDNESGYFGWIHTELCLFHQRSAVKLPVRPNGQGLKKRRFTPMVIGSIWDFLAPPLA